MVPLFNYCVLLLLSPLVFAYHVLRFLFVLDVGSTTMSVLPDCKVLVL